MTEIWKPDPNRRAKRPERVPVPVFKRVKRPKPLIEDQITGQDQDGRHEYGLTYHRLAGTGQWNFTNAHRHKLSAQYNERHRYARELELARVSDQVAAEMKQQRDERAIYDRANEILREEFGATASRINPPKPRVFSPTCKYQR